MSSNHESVSPLNEIVAELGRTTPIDRRAILRWMHTDDIEAMGALTSLLGEPRHLERVRPSMTFDDWYTFVVKYYERIFSENPDGEWSDSRITGGWDFAKWFVELWEDETVSRDVLLQLKEMLARLCKQGRTDICNGLVTAVLEHLFKRREIRSYFSDWDKEPVLRAARDEASYLADVALKLSPRR
ncbi:MAG: hypothetical protein ACRD8U_02595 [Pyrinomonadaceae bacterium]